MLVIHENAYLGLDIFYLLPKADLVQQAIQRSFCQSWFVICIDQIISSSLALK